jgi:hypothetical protein
MFSLICGHQIKGKHNKGLDFDHKIKARAHKGDMRMGKMTQTLYARMNKINKKIKEKLLIIWNDGCFILCV